MTLAGHNGGPPLNDIPYADRDGFITVGRSIRNHPIVGFGITGPYVPAEAWLDLIMECKYREGRVINGGRLMTIAPGQLVGAVSWLATRWQWTPKQVRRFLDKLEADGMITKAYPDEKRDMGATCENPDNQNDKHKGKQAHFITICNYAIYQFVEEKTGQIKGQTEGQITGKQGANEGQQYKEEQRNTGIQEDKKVEEEKAAADQGRSLVVIAANAAPVSGGELIPSYDLVEPYEAFRTYNDLAQRICLPMARTLTPSRRKALCARLSEHGPESWNIALANIERSSFLRGRNDRNWRANFDFIVQAASYAKLVDGVYGNGAHAGPTGDETYFERMARLAGVDISEPTERDLS